MGNAQSLTATNIKDDKTSGNTPFDDLPFDLRARYSNLKTRVHPDWDQASQSNTSDTSSVFEDCYEDGLLGEKGHEDSGQNSNENEGRLHQLPFYGVPFGHEGVGEHVGSHFVGPHVEVIPTMEDTSGINPVPEATVDSTGLPTPSCSGDSHLPKVPSYIHLQSPSVPSPSNPSSSSFSDFLLRLSDEVKGTTEETKVGDDSQCNSSTTCKPATIGSPNLFGFDSPSSVEDDDEDQEEGPKRDDNDGGSPTPAIDASSKISVPISATASNTLSDDETDDKDGEYTDHELLQRSILSPCDNTDNSQPGSDSGLDLVDLDGKTKDGDEGKEKDEDDLPKPTPNTSLTTSTTVPSDSVLPSSIDDDENDSNEVTELSSAASASAHVPSVLDAAIPVSSEPTELHERMSQMNERIVQKRNELQKTQEELQRKARLARLGKEHVTKDSFGVGVREPEGDVDDLKTELETLKRTLANEILEREILKEEKAKVEARVENMLDLVEHYNIVVEESKKRVEETERKVDESERVVEETKKVLKGEEEKVVELAKENEGLKGRVRVLEEENEVLEARVSVLEGEVEGLKEEVEGQKEKVDNLRKQLGEEMERKEEELEKANEMIKIYRERKDEEERAMAHASSERRSVLTVSNGGADIESLRTRLRAGRLGKE